MVIKKHIIKAGFLSTICRFGDTVVDWASAGKQYFLDGTTKQIGAYHIAFSWDAAITSDCGQYAFLYQKLGTKGVLVKNGIQLREVNRPYYFANSYEYPAAFVTHNQITYLVHCPVEYCRLDFENVETGEIITDISGRDPDDVFYSRLEVNCDGTVLMSRGWVWHPREVVEFFKVDECLKSPLLLDKSTIYPNVDVEICTASFIDESKVLIGSSDEAFDEERNEFPLKGIAIWDLSSNQILNPVKVNGEFGNLFAINENFAWDVFDYPKIINIKTGEIVAKTKSVKTGKQKSSIVSSKNLSQIVFNRHTKQLAIKGKEQIIILTPPKGCF